MHDEIGHGSKPPKNPINANLTEFRLEMSDLPSNYTNTRYAIEVIFFSTAEANPKEATHKTTQYIDDEYTPGVFEIWSIQLLVEPSKVNQTYVTWKPVSYHSPKLKRSDQGLVNKFLWKDNDAVTKLHNPLPVYSGSKPWTLVDGMTASYYGVNVTFGISKDGFYNAHPYLSWLVFLFILHIKS